MFNKLTNWFSKNCANTVYLNKKCVKHVSQICNKSNLHILVPFKENFSLKDRIKEDQNQQRSKVWIIPNWIFIALSVCAYLLMDSTLKADTINQKFNEPVWRENFNDIKSKLEQNDPLITSLNIRFILTDKELEELDTSIQDNTELGYISWHKKQSKRKLLNKINNKLIENNKEYRYHPNDYVHGLLSKHAYKDSNEKDPITLPGILEQPLENWYVEKVYNDNDISGYYGVIYRNDKTHQIVLANRGTDEQTFSHIISTLNKKGSDWKTNFEVILAGQIMGGQMAWNFKATAEAIKIAREKTYRLSFTGHSLGAWLAEMSVFYCHAYFDYFTTKGVTFDSPGSLPMMERLQTNIKNKNVLELKNLDITTYLASPNPVNACNPHVGKAYRVYPQMPSIEEYMPSFFLYLPEFIQNKLKNNFQDTIKGVLAVTGHDLARILPTFDPQTGKPRNCKYMKDWPRMEYKGNSFSQKETEFIKNSIKNYVVPEDFELGKIGDVVAKKVTNWSINGLVEDLVGDKTIMTLIGFVKSFINNDIGQKQYWLYYKHKGFDDDNNEIKTELHYDKRFDLVFKVKYNEGKEKYILNPVPGTLDHFLHKLHKNRAKYTQNTDSEYLSSIVAKQLSELLSNYDIIPIDDQSNSLIAVNQDCDIESVIQRASRLRKVIPEQKWQIDKTDKDTPSQISPNPVEFVINNNLPNPPLHYTEMGNTKKDLEEKLDKYHVVVISGPGGMGKSTLAAEYGRNKKQKGGQVRWINGQKIDLEFAYLAEALNINTEDLNFEEIKNLVFEAFNKQLGKEKIALIFDNVENKEKMKQCLINLPNHVHVVITTRNRNLLDHDYSTIELRGFNTAEAIAYLKEFRNTNETGSENQIEEFVKKVSESPFRLFRAVSYLKNNNLKTLDEFIEQYESIERELLPTENLLSGDSKKDLAESSPLLQYLAYLDIKGVSVSFISKIMTEEGQLDKLDKDKKQLERFGLVDVITDGNNQKILRLSHKVVQDETKKMLIEENKTQASMILKQLSSKLDEAVNEVLLSTDEKNRDWERLPELTNHIKALIKEIDNANSLNPSGLFSKIRSSFWETLGYDVVDDKKMLLSKIEAIGSAYKKEKKDIIKGIQYDELSLKIRQELFPEDHLAIASALMHTALSYYKLGDSNKTLEYIKQAYSIYTTLNEEKIQYIKSYIESVQKNFFTDQENAQKLQEEDCLGGNKIGSECRWIISSRGEMNDNLIMIKQKIQKPVLDKIVKAVDTYGWSYYVKMWGEYGVKGYIDSASIKKELGLGYRNIDIEAAQMLCFESMNLGIMKSIKKPYTVVEEFTRAYPELVKKIAKVHPEFFVDGSIVEACIRAMSGNKSFEKYILKHVKYMGMAERKAAASWSINSYINEFKDFFGN